MNELVLAQALGAEGPSPYGPMLVMAGVFSVFWFLVIRPQQRKEKDKEAMRSALKRGEDIVTSAGMHGRIVDLQDKLLVVEIAPNVRVKMERACVEAVPSRVAREEKAAAAEKSKEAAGKKP